MALHVFTWPQLTLLLYLLLLSFFSTYILCLKTSGLPTPKLYPCHSFCLDCSPPTCTFPAEDFIHSSKYISNTTSLQSRSSIDELSLSLSLSLLDSLITHACSVSRTRFLHLSDPSSYLSIHERGCIAYLCNIYQCVLYTLNIQQIHTELISWRKS